MVSVINFCPSFVDDSRFDVESTHPFCCHQTRWSGADDEHIDFGRVGCCGLHDDDDLV